MLVWYPIFVLQNKTRIQLKKFSSGVSISWPRKYQESVSQMPIYKNHQRKWTDLVKNVQERWNFFFCKAEW